MLIDYWSDLSRSFIAVFFEWAIHCIFKFISIVFLRYTHHHASSGNLSSKQIAVVDNNLKHLKNYREYYNDRQIE